MTREQSSRPRVWRHGGCFGGRQTLAAMRNLARPSAAMLGGLLLVAIGTSGMRAQPAAAGPPLIRAASDGERPVDETGALDDGALDDGALSTLVGPAIEQLLELQADDGSWAYEGVYRVRREIPVGYRIGGTALVCQALFYAAPDHGGADAAIRRGLAVMLEDLEHPLMRPSREDTYDVRVWGHIYSLDLFCRLRASDRYSDLDATFDNWIDRLLEALIEEELEGGGWNYAGRRAHAAFVTAPAVQSLLWARSLQRDVPDEVLQRAFEALRGSRETTGAFTYSGPIGGRGETELPGSIARSAICESTLRLLGAPESAAIAESIEAFYRHWDELEKRRQKTGTHVPPYGVAPYYFYYGHRYLAQAIQFLPEERKEAEAARFREVLLATRDEDGTWNDRVFAQSKSYGTAMAILALIDAGVPLPPARSEP